MNKVKEICIRQGITPKELAAKVGVSQPTVSDWFNNKKNPSGSRLAKLSELFGVSRAVILGLDDLPSAENTSPQKNSESAEFENLRKMNRIKQCRIAKGMSQKYVSLALGVAGPSVSNWESGKTNPSNEKLQQLADLFGVTTDYLLGRDGPPPIPPADVVELQKKEASMRKEVLEIMQSMNDEQYEMVLNVLKVMTGRK